MARTRLLIHQGLDARHDGRGKGSSACTGPAAGGTSTRRTTVGSVGPAKDVEVAPKAVSSEEGDVWSVADAVVGIAENGLPRGFRPAFARATNNVARRGRASRAGAGAATTGRRALHQCPEKRSIAKATWSIQGTIAFVLREERTSAGIVPRNLRDIREGRSEDGRVAGIPVGAVGIGKGVAEISSPYRDVVGS